MAKKQGTSLMNVPLIIFQSESSDEEVGDDDVNLAKKGRGRPKKAGTNEVEVNICVN